MRAAIACVLLAAGCYDVKTKIETTTAKRSTVVNVQADSSADSAWVTFRNIKTTRAYFVSEQVGSGIRPTRALVGESEDSRDVVWLCKRDPAGVPQCTRAVFGGMPTPAPKNQSPAPPAELDASP